MTPSGPSATLEAIKERNKIVNSSDVPRLVAALEAALSFHGNVNGGCMSCCDAYGERVEFPCDEYKDITRALKGESSA